MFSGVPCHWNNHQRGKQWGEVEANLQVWNWPKTLSLSLNWIKNFSFSELINPFISQDLRPRRWQEREPWRDEGNRWEPFSPDRWEQERGQESKRGEKNTYSISFWSTSQNTLTLFSIFPHWITGEFTDGRGPDVGDGRGLWRQHHWGGDGLSIFVQTAKNLV